jgi:hypothetical protein
LVAHTTTGKLIVGLLRAISGRWSHMVLTLY